MNDVQNTSLYMYMYLSHEVQMVTINQPSIQGTETVTISPQSLSSFPITWLIDQAAAGLCPSSGPNSPQGSPGT